MAEPQGKKICWLTMACEKQKYCIGDKCAAFIYKQCAIPQGLNTLSYYINQHVIKRRAEEGFDE